MVEGLRLGILGSMGVTLNIETPIGRVEAGTLNIRRSLDRVEPVTLNIEPPFDRVESRNSSRLR